MVPVSESRRIPLTAQATYSDLLAYLKEDSVLDTGGTPTLRKRKGRKYWYAVRRLAGHTVERYLGPDSRELRSIVERSLQIREDERARGRRRSDLVRMCREGGLPTMDAQTGKILLALARAGLFRLRGVLVGTHAFRFYPALLGVSIPESTVSASDIDLAAFPSVSVALDDHLDPGLVEVLGQVGPFVSRPGLYRHPTAWRNPKDGAQVELLAANEGSERDGPVELPAAGAWAQPLRFLDYLIHRPVQAAGLYRSGVLLNVPQPARYAVHKLIVAVRRVRAAPEKAAKDIAQAAALIRVFAEDRPDELEEAYADACGRGLSWRRHLDRGAERLPADARGALRAVARDGTGG